MLAMFASSLGELALVAGSFISGVVASGITRLLLRKAKRSGPLLLKRKGTDETVLIPEHYNADAVDKLLKQLKAA